MANEQSRVLTLVFTDLADSTALKSARGDVAVGDLISRHRDHVTRLAEECAGRIIDWAGDGCFLTFETASAGVLFALRLQQAHSDATDLPGVRIGIHMGEVTEKPNPEGDDKHPRIEGLAVDVAARVSGLAKPGQVLMSSSVHNSAKQRMGVEIMGMPLLWQLHGTYELKGFDAPLDIAEAGLEGIAALEAPRGSEKARLVKRAKRRKGEYGDIPARGSRAVPMWAVAIIVVLAVAVAYLLGTRQPAPTVEEAAVPVATPGDAPITSIAVLPLENLTSDSEQDYFADSMTEAITAELASIKALTVRGRTSAMQYADTALSIPEIAQALRVDALIEGSVVRDGDDVRVTVQLVHGASDSHLWSESYTETMTSVLKLQSDVALAIAEAINAEVTGEERSNIANERTVHPEAYEAYVLGEYFDQQRTEDDNIEAERHFEDAVRLEPEFAEAWARLGDMYRVSTYGGARRAPAEGMNLARNAYQRAIELDPSLALAHTGLGYVAFEFDRQWGRAEESFRHALDLSPNDADTHNDYGLYLATVGRWDESVQHASTALDLDPGDPEEVNDAAFNMTNAGRIERSIDTNLDLLRERPDYASGLLNLAQGYSLQGRHEEAIAAAERAVELDEGSQETLLNLALTYAKADNAVRAEALIEEALQSDTHIENYSVALVYANLGDLDEAFEWYEKGFTARNRGMIWLRADTSNGFVRPEVAVAFLDDERYWDLVERIGFPALLPDHPGYAKQQEWRTRKAAADRASEPIERIAVLPFANISGDAEQEWFVDGMTEALTMELARIKALTIVSRTSAMQYKNVLRPISEIARELNVDALVEGSAIQQGDRVRITAQLIDGRTDEHLWAQRYDGTMEDIFSLQSEVALAIAEEVQAAVTPEEESRMASANPIEPEAYKAYLKGMYFWNRRELNEAIPHFEQAIELAPDSPLAHSGLANTYVLMGTFGLLPPQIAFTRTREYAQRAIELDATLPDSYAALAWSLVLMERDWAASDEAFVHAQELDPEFAPAMYWYAISLAYRGRFEEAFAEIGRALDVDPVSIPAGRLNVYVHHYARRVEDVIRLGVAHMKIAPHDGMVLGLVADEFVRLSRFDEARNILAQYPDALAGGTGGPGFAGYKQLGMETEARAVLAELLERAYAAPIGIARVLIGLDESDAALEKLEEAVRVGGAQLAGLPLDPYFEPLRDDPRFQALVEALNMPQEP